MAIPMDVDYRLAFDLAPVGLCVSRQRVIQHCNAALATMFGFTAEALAGQSLACLYPSSREFESIGSRGWTAMHETGRYSDERIMRHNSGRLFWCHVAGRSLDQNDPFACAVWMFEDISAKRPVQAELTAREREVAALVTKGLTAKEIGKALGISPRTVEIYRARLMRKYQASSAADLIQRLIAG